MLICINRIVEADVVAGVLYAVDCHGNHLHITGGLHRLKQALDEENIEEIKGPLSVKVSYEGDIP